MLFFYTLITSIFSLRFKYLDELGHGRFGTVWLGRCRRQAVAIKVLSGQADENSRAKFHLEVKIMRCLLKQNCLLCVVFFLFLLTFLLLVVKLLMPMYVFILGVR